MPTSASGRLAQRHRIRRPGRCDASIQARIAARETSANGEGANARDALPDTANPRVPVVDLDVLNGRRGNGLLDHVPRFEQARLPASAVQLVAEDDRVAFAAVHVLDDAASKDTWRSRISGDERWWNMPLDGAVRLSDERGSVRPEPRQAGF